MKQEHVFGVSFVLLLHMVALYGLWSYRIIPTPDEEITLMVNLINPPPPERPKPPKPRPPEPPKPRDPEPPPPEPPPVAAEAPVATPEEPVVYVPPPPPIIEALPLPPEPVVLTSQLAVNCPERSPPEYPSLSKRLNEQGRVLLRVELGEDGRVVKAEVKSSSGFQRLDDAALNAVRVWRCNPPVQDGVPVRAVALQPFNFILGGR